MNTQILARGKTYIAGGGLVALALYQLSQGSIEQAITTFLAGLTVLGLRHELPATAPEETGPWPPTYT